MTCAQSNWTLHVGMGCKSLQLVHSRCFFIHKIVDRWTVVLLGQATAERSLEGAARTTVWLEKELKTSLGSWCVGGVAFWFRRGVRLFRD